MRHTVCVDLDGTLADYSGGWQGVDYIGPPFAGAVEFTKRLSDFADVVIFTCRCNEALGGRTAPEAAAVVRAWLDKHGFAYHSVYAGQGKPFASAYVDDLAVPCAPQFGPTPAYLIALQASKALCGVRGDSP